jgi:signal transduction histidine kinase
MEKLTKNGVYKQSQINDPAGLPECSEFITALINESCEGIVVLDANRQFVLGNPLGERYLRKIDYNPGSGYHIPLSHETNKAIEIQTGADKKLMLKVRYRPVLWKKHDSWLIFLQEVTDSEHPTLQQESNEELRRLKSNLEREVAETVEMMLNRDAMLISQSRQVFTGEMVANISNQWKQPLNALSIIIQSIKDSYDYDELTSARLDEKVRLSVELIDYLARTIDDFRDYFQPGKQMQIFDLRILIEKTINFIEYSFETDSVRLQLDLANNCHTTGYPNEFSQALLNILINAREIMKQRNIPEPERLLKICLFSENHNSVITVEDNAGGISPENLSRIFEPYFTTKKEKGTGLGLYMSRNIIEVNMNGRLTVSNTENGAKFRIEI